MSLLHKQREQTQPTCMVGGGTLQQRSCGGLTALELGSGNGFLSVCLAALAPDLFEEIVVTDTSDHLPLIEQTLRANTHILSLRQPENKHAENDSKRQDNRVGRALTERSDFPSSGDHRMRPWVTVIEHLWGEFSEGIQSSQDNEACDERNAKTRASELEKHVREGTKKFDFIFGSDLAYRDELHAPLIASLKKFSHVGTVAMIGVTMNDTKPKFFTALKQAGFKYDRVADHFYQPEFRGSTFGLIAVQRR